MKRSKRKYSSNSWLAIALLASITVSLFPINKLHGHNIQPKQYCYLERPGFIDLLSTDGSKIPFQEHKNHYKIKTDYCSLCDFIFNSNYIGSEITFQTQISQAKVFSNTFKQGLIPVSKPLTFFNKGSPIFG